MKWIDFKDGSGCMIDNYALIPWYRIDDENLVLIDSGFCTGGTRHLDCLREHGCRAAAIINTHFHMDHVGCNRQFFETFGTKIYAHSAEIYFGRHLYEVAERYGMPEEDFVDWDEQRLFDFDVTPFPEMDEHTPVPLTVCGQTFTLVPLYGHSEGHTGVILPNGLFCVGDALMTRPALDHARMPFTMDGPRARDTLRYLKAHLRPGKYAVAHLGIVSSDDMPALIDYNIKNDEQIENAFRAFAAQNSRPASYDRDYVDRAIAFMGVRLEHIHTKSIVRCIAWSRLSQLTQDRSL